MAVTTATITATTVAALLASAGNGTLTDPVPVTVSAAAVNSFVGGSGVTATTGIPLAANTPLSFALVKGDDLYVITSASTVAVNVMKGRQ